MRYRVAEHKDLEEIIQMKNEVKKRIIEENLPIWLDGYPFDEMILEDIEKGYGRVLEEDEEIVGYACFHPAEVEYPPHTFKKENLQSFGRVMVKEGYVGKHYGSYLVISMIEEAKTMGVEGLGILADACNTKAVRLYKKYGFQKEGSKQFPYAYLDIYGLYFK
ncbi:MAG: GNAT family N-acetyltransferase [Roseburia sp.]|nr:GNAT family N-acetyltransferase [Anaeroplasma bactoclasticum]MCM1195838.1 GNAT family N-acetyltransferase [Roseburia sp.]MCM1556309.1 GNAT family N-acetyltransferase [Anaeroplasma bactoclasticum]